MFWKRKSPDEIEDLYRQVGDIVERIQHGLEHQDPGVSWHIEALNKIIKANRELRTAKGPEITHRIQVVRAKDYDRKFLENMKIKSDA